jgi:hypothetical protein
MQVAAPHIIFGEELALRLLTEEEHMPSFKF